MLPRVYPGICINRGDAMDNLIYDAYSIAYQLATYIMPDAMGDISTLMGIYTVAAILLVIPYVTAFACLYACVRGVLGVFNCD